jgi:putative ABC transport system ATP-binding protein
MELILKLNKDLGTTIILVTHDPRIGEQAERVLRIRDGKVESEE